MAACDEKLPFDALTPDDVASIVRSSVPVAEHVTQLGSSDAMGQRDEDEPIVVAIGAFDGVHLGHRRLLSACVAQARELGGRSVVVTFDPDPSEVIGGARAQRRLLSVADRLGFARAVGIDETLVISFDEQVAAWSPSAFVDWLVARLGRIDAIHVGENFRFGHHGEGDVAVLRELGRERGFVVVTHPLLTVGDATVSSTRIRTMLGAGDVRGAAELLGRHHFVRGMVAHGRGEGTAFGFPTANVTCDGRTCMPGEGVYACLVSDGTHAWPAAANVGKPPTFSDEREAAFLEANLIGFEGDLYGRELAVVFLEWLRASRPFDSLEELEHVVLGNIDWVRTHVGDAPVEVGI